MHGRLKKDLDDRIADNLPELPEKKYFFNRTVEFLEGRMKALNKYMKQIILIYEAIENPILQKFLKIDVNFDPNYEYSPIPFDKPNTWLIRGGDALDIEGYNMFWDLP